MNTANGFTWLWFQSLTRLQYSHFLSSGYLLLGDSAPKTGKSFPVAKETQQKCSRRQPDRRIGTDKPCSLQQAEELVEEG